MRARLVQEEVVLNERGVEPGAALVCGSRLRTDQLHSPPGPWGPLGRLGLLRTSAARDAGGCARSPKARARRGVLVESRPDLRGLAVPGVLVELRVQGRHPSDGASVDAPSVASSDSTLADSAYREGERREALK